MKKIFIGCLLLSFITPCRSQVLISIIFGDKLNSDKMIFGLMLGNGWNDLTGYSTSTMQSNFNLGLFLNLKLRHKFSLDFNALAKYKLGAKGLPVYSLNDPLIDSIFQYGSIQRTISYLGLVATLQYRCWKDLCIELGPQVILRTKARDIFKTAHESGDLKFEKDIASSLTRFDFGAMGGISWQFNKGTGVRIAARYYAGLIDIAPSEAGMNATRSIQVNAFIPVGRQKAKK